MKSNISKLSRLGLIKVIVKRLIAIGKGSTEKTKDLYDYAPNKLAKELHPTCQHLKVVEIKEFSKDMKSFILAPDAEAGTSSLAWFSAGQYLSISVDIDGTVFVFR